MRWNRPRSPGPRARHHGSTALVLGDQALVLGLQALLSLGPEPGLQLGDEAQGVLDLLLGLSCFLPMGFVAVAIFFSGSTFGGEQRLGLREALLELGDGGRWILGSGRSAGAKLGELGREVVTGLDDLLQPRLGDQALLHGRQALLGLGAELGLQLGDEVHGASELTAAGSSMRGAALGDGGSITTLGSFSARPPHTMRARSPCTSTMTSNEDTAASR